MLSSFLDPLEVIIEHHLKNYLRFYTVLPNPVRKEWQPRPAPITFEQVTRLAQEILLRDGHHAPTLIIDGSTRPVIVQIDGLALTPSHIPLRFHLI